MKIRKVEIIPVDIPYKMPFRVSYGGITSGSYIILRIVTDEGVDGVGSSIGFGKIGLNRESAMATMKSIASALLLGMDPLNTEAILSRIDAANNGMDHVTDVELRNVDAQDAHVRVVDVH